MKTLAPPVSVCVCGFGLVARGQAELTLDWAEFAIIHFTCIFPLTSPSQWKCVPSECSLRGTLTELHGHVVSCSGGGGMYCDAQSGHILSPSIYL